MQPRLGELQARAYIFLVFWKLNFILASTDNHGGDTLKCYGRKAHQWSAGVTYTVKSIDEV